jgi:thiazole/oxazole-forming peptide maturase SagC family component
MDRDSPHKIVCRLPNGVRVFASTPDELRFRKGVWSYTEALVNLENQDLLIRNVIIAISQELLQKDEASVTDVISRFGLNEDQSQKCLRILDDLKSQGFLVSADDTSIGMSISSLLGGQLLGFEQSISKVKPVLFVSDTDHAISAAKDIAGKLGLPLDVLDRSATMDIGGMNLTDRTDAIALTSSMERVGKLFTPYGCVVASFASPKVLLLRNINRILVRLEKPLILGLIDGPFVSVLSALAPQTGCFECFEHRMLARLEDTLVYHKFVESQRNVVHNGDQDRGTIPALHMIVAAVLSEAFLYASSGLCRLAGRCVNIYLPLLEIQVEDLLRIGYCPACGHVAKLQMDEMYTSSREIVKAMLRNIEITQES